MAISVEAIQPINVCRDGLLTVASYPDRLCKVETIRWPIFQFGPYCR